MIPLQGRIIQGLDEFMLRLGHLSVLCNTACEIGGPSFRLERETAAQLTQLVPIPSERMDESARYLQRKSLCPTGGAVEPKLGTGRPKFRYPHLVVKADAHSDRFVVSSTEDPSEPPTIWWQDYCLSESGVRSRVGAVTVEAKTGSKTGLSHILDWADLLELVGRGGQTAPEARLICKLGERTAGLKWTRNPYIPAEERIVYAYIFASADMDVFSRLLPMLVQAVPPIKKAGACQLYGECLRRIADEAERSRDLSGRRQFHIFQQVRELERAARGKETLGASSTAWHRIGSRLETLVDLGLLEKGVGGEHEAYEYVYHPGERLSQVAASLEAAADADVWLEEELISNAFGVSTAGAVDVDGVVELLPEVVQALSIPTAVLPIRAVALGVAMLGMRLGRTMSLGAARRAIERLALSRPDLARLSRGTSTEKAGFVSLDIRKLQ